MDRDDSVDRVAEVLSRGLIDMRTLAVVSPVDYIECREVVAALWPALEAMADCVRGFVAEWQELGLTNGS